MKKNNLLSLLALVVAVALCGIFAACGDDNDEPKGNTPSLVGTWENTGRSGYIQWTFRANNTGSALAVFYGETPEPASEFTYINDTKTGNVSITYQGDDYTLIYHVEELTGTQLVVKGVNIEMTATFVKVKN